MKTSESIALLYYAWKAAIRAGREIIDVYQGDIDVSLKADASPLTEADLRAHRAILDTLRAASPDIPVLSEEAASVPYDERKDWNQCWLVDPLDGTKEFIKRNGEFTVNIAWVNANGESVLGVVYAPALGHAYLGARGVGAFRWDAQTKCALPENGDALLRQACALPVARGDRPYTVVASRSHLSRETEDYVAQLRERHPGLVLQSAGSALKLCLVAEGVADCYPRFGPTMEWDTAAGEAVCAAAGARVTVYPSGEPMRYNKQDLLNPWFLIER